MSGWIQATMQQNTIVDYLFVIHICIIFLHNLICFLFFRPTPTTSWIQLALTSKKKAQMAAAAPSQQKYQKIVKKSESHKYHTIILEHFSAKE